MKIARVAAYSVNPRLTLDILPKKLETAQGFTLVEIETDTGIVGTGITGITDTSVVQRVVERVGPGLIGMDPMMIEQIWDKLYWQLSPRGQTGIAQHAMAAIDIALWDIKGKALNEPVWRLLGGARSRVPLYVTFGFHFYDRDELCDAARAWIKRGFKRVKMTVADGALRNRDSKSIADQLKEDAWRVRAVRDAVGDDIEIYVDANCNLDHYHALKIARAIEPYGISFLEEPITQNDARQMADLRRAVPIPLACGQNEGLAFRFRDLLLNQSIDFVQPNVCITGGFTQAQKIVGMASAFNVPFANGGGWPYENMHLIAGAANGTLVEFHYMATEACKSIFDGLPEPKDGFMEMPDRPGLGYTLNRDRLKDVLENPAGGRRG